MEALKEKWECPELSLQQFSPQEYITACYRYCCDCESSNNAGSDLYYGLYTWVSGDRMGNGCFAEAGNPSIKHHGPDCINDSDFDYICHTTNTGLNATNINNWYEIWNEYRDVGLSYQIISPYGANKPTFTGTEANVLGQLQKFVYFTDAKGKTHYGRAIAMPGKTWNHS